MAIRQLQEKVGSKASVLAAGCPHHGSQAQVLLIKQKNVQKVANLAASGKGENLVCGKISLVQAIAPAK